MVLNKQLYCQSHGRNRKNEKYWDTLPVFRERLEAWITESPLRRAHRVKISFSSPTLYIVSIHIAKHNKVSQDAAEKTKFPFQEHIRRKNQSPNSITVRPQSLYHTMRETLHVINFYSTSSKQKNVFTHFMNKWHIQKFGAVQ